MTARRESEMKCCPECEGSGLIYGFTDPAYRDLWCGRCYGTGVIETGDEQ